MVETTTGPRIQPHTCSNNPCHQVAIAAQSHRLNGCSRKLECEVKLSVATAGSVRAWTLVRPRWHGTLRSCTRVSRQKHDVENAMHMHAHSRKSPATRYPLLPMRACTTFAAPVLVSTPCTCIHDVRMHGSHWACHRGQAAAPVYSTFADPCQGHPWRIELMYAWQCVMRLSYAWVILRRINSAESTPWDSQTFYTGPLPSVWTCQKSGHRA